jgi:serine/threonine protein kinase
VEDALTSGARIGSYEVIDRLGAGGMGEVYRARDTRLGRTVALKVLRSGSDPDLLRRLDREARAASALNHPNIVHIYDVGEAAGHEGAHFVVMELVEGETLRARLRPGPLPLSDLLSLGAQLADGLAKAHRAGIVHRDLKPENVMITPDGVLKILDFGLAKVLAAPLGEVDDARQTLSRQGTQVGTLMGTLEYMSPEQASGRAVDHRTDQFSLGLILHEMATGRSAFRRASPAQVLAAVIERDPEPLRRLRGDVPAPLEALVSRCLQKDPERRYAKTDEIAAEMATLAGRSRSGSLAEGPIPPVTSPAVSVEVLPPPPAPPAVAPIYHVQAKKGVRRYAEAELTDLIRRGKLSGVELVRRDDEESWQPLFESRVFRREVPSLDDPRDAARLNVLRGVGAHFSGFFITSVVMYATQGHFPFWLGIWGAVLFMQGVGAAPAAWTLLQRRRSTIPGAGAPRGLPGEAAGALPAGTPAPGASAMAQEAARVRALIAQRGGDDAPSLLAEVDAILKLTEDLAAREADLEEQTSPAERAALTKAVAEARARLERADLEQDRRLFERQLEVVQGREEAIAKAVRLLERLRVRREVAEHQLKQLRLDLSRGAVREMDMPEVSSRLQFIRDEVDAREEVAEIGARRP